MADNTETHELDAELVKVTKNFEVFKVVDGQAGFGQIYVPRDAMAGKRTVTITVSAA